MSLKITVFTTSDLLEFGYAFFEMAITGLGMKNMESKVNLSMFHNLDAPLHIMISKGLVPVMKRFWSEKIGRI